MNTFGVVGAALTEFGGLVLPFLPLAALPGALPALNGTFDVDLPSALHTDTAP